MSTEIHAADQVLLVVGTHTVTLTATEFLNNGVPIGGGGGLVPHGNEYHTSAFVTQGEIDAAINTHKALSASVHNFDASGNAPPQSHDNTRHSAAYALDSALAAHVGAAAPHTGHELVGKLTFPGPVVLTLGAIAEGEYGRRVGSTFVGGTPGGGASPPWYSVLYVAEGECDPVDALRENDILNTVAGPTPTGIGITVARCVLFRTPAALTVNRIRLFAIAAVASLYKFAIYPKAAGSARLWESGTVTTVANSWLNITAGLPITLAANTEYWFCVTAAAVGTTAAFRTRPAPLHANVFAASASILGNRHLGLAEYVQFAVTGGAFPATLPTLVAAAFAGGSTGSVPLAFLDNSSS